MSKGQFLPYTTRKQGHVNNNNTLLSSILVDHFIGNLTIIIAEQYIRWGGTNGHYRCSKTIERVITQDDYSGFDEIDLVVEAVIEEIEIKRQVFNELDEVCTKDSRWRRLVM